MTHHCLPCHLNIIKLEMKVQRKRKLGLEINFVEPLSLCSACERTYNGVQQCRGQH